MFVFSLVFSRQENLTFLYLFLVIIKGNEKGSFSHVNMESRIDDLYVGSWYAGF